MAGRAPKTVKVLQMEGKSHRTKRELAIRQHMEADNATGYPIREEAKVRQDPVAHREFRRVMRLMKALEKNDDLFGAEINLYCQLKGEIEQEEQTRDKWLEAIRNLEAQARMLDEPKDVMEANKIVMGMMTGVRQCENRIAQKRRLRMDIEKRNMMDIASSLRGVTRAQDKPNPLKEALGK